MHKQIHSLSSGNAPESQHHISGEYSSKFVQLQANGSHSTPLMASKSKSLDSLLAYSPPEINKDNSIVLYTKKRADQTPEGEIVSAKRSSQGKLPGHKKM